MHAGEEGLVKVTKSDMCGGGIPSTYVDVRDNWLAQIDFFWKKSKGTSFFPKHFIADFCNLDKYFATKFW